MSATQAAATRRRVVVPAPGPWLNSNDRRHWRKQAEITAAWRQAAAWAVKAAKVPPLVMAHIVAELHFERDGRRDPGNWYPTAKAVIDGLVDVGVLPDDSAEYLTGPDMRLGEKTPTAGGYLVLLIDGTEASHAAS